MSRGSSEQRDSLLNGNEKNYDNIKLDSPTERRERHFQRRLLGLSAALSSLLTIAITLGLQAYMSSTFTTLTTSSDVFLPTLDLPPLGRMNRVFEPEEMDYSVAPNNHTRQAWMNLFPKGKGYVSMSSIESAGPVADFVQHQSSDGTGRFGIAAFHQLHCLYLIYEDFYGALDGTLAEPGMHFSHCLDYLRESVMCAADTTLEPFKGKFDAGGGGKGVDGTGSVHQCRDFIQVYEWAERFRYNDDTDGARFEG